MYKIRFDDLVFLSNSKTVSRTNVVFFFYGLGLTSDVFKNLLLGNRVRSQILIPDLPGHNNRLYRNSKQNLVEFARKIYLFIKKKKMDNIFFFSHSIGGIIPIILTKRFLKNQVRIKKFINYEGNLTKFDTQSITRKTISYKEKEFKKKFVNLIEICKKSDKKQLNNWAITLKKTSSLAFYKISKEAVELSETNELYNFFRTFFKKKVYVFGSLSELYFSECLFGSIRFKIKNAGHFSFFENTYEFSKMFNTLITKK